MASIVASPVLVGAVTVLVILIAVVLAYNANKGLPFVPTYEVKAELPNGANLVEGNEVRVGGFRVGVVDRISTTSIEEEGGARAIAVVDLKLDKQVEPLTTDTQVLVRQRSALGLKYVQLTPGAAETTFQPGDTIPLANAGEPVEFDDFLATFDDELRANSRDALEGYGDALAGRGQSINTALAELPGFLGYLTDVMDSLNDESTQLDQFFRQIGRASAQVAPVARVQADLFTNMAETFEAFSRDPAALQATIEAAPPTLDEAIESFRVQRPFLADFAELSRRLRPAAQELPRSLPAINSAFRVGQDVLPRTVAFQRRLEDVFASLDELASDPNTRLALEDLTTTTDVAAPLLTHLNPYQSVCNYATYFLVPLGEHISEQVQGGTIQRVLVRTTNQFQDNSLSDYFDADRPPDAPKAVDPQEDTVGPPGEEGPPDVLHSLQDFPAVDDKGRADCVNGQTGYLDGPVNRPDHLYPLRGDAERFKDVEDLNDQIPDRGGGFHTVTDPDLPYAGDGGRAGPTFNPNRPGGLNFERLQQVP